MKKILGVLSILSFISLSVFAAGGFKNFSVDTMRFGSSSTGLRSLVFDKSEDANSAKITVDPANEQFSFNNQVNILDKLFVDSVLEASRPYPAMTEAERDALTPNAGEIIYNTTANQINFYDGADWTLVGGGGLDKWVALEDYKTDDVIWLEDDNKIYRSLSDFTAGASFDPMNWTELSDQFYKNSDDVLRESGYKFKQDSLTYNGFPEFNDPSVFTVGNDPVFGNGTGGTAVTKSIVPTDLLTGTSSWKVSSASQNDWISLSYNAPAYIQNDGRRHSVKVRYNTTSDEHWQERVKCDSDQKIDSLNAKGLTAIDSEIIIEYKMDQGSTFCTVGFQCVHSSGCADLVFSEVVVSDDLRVITPIVEMSEWGPATDITTSWDANADNLIFSRRVGDTMEVWGRTTLNSAPTGDFFIQTPSIDISKLVENLEDTYFLGIASIKDASDSTRSRTSADAPDVGGQNAIRVRYFTQNTLAISWGNAIANQFTPITFASGDTVNFSFKIPILGWKASTSGTVFASDSNKEDVVVKASGNADTVLTANVTDIDWIEVSDIGEHWNGTQFTVPETGIYTFSGMIQFTAIHNMEMGIYINGTYVEDIAREVSDSVLQFSTTRNLNKNEVISFRMATGATLFNNDAKHHIEITKQALNINNLILQNPDGAFEDQIRTTGTNITTTGVQSDFTFTGLDTDSKYILFHNVSINIASGSENSKQGDYTIFNGATPLIYGANAASNVFNFKATSGPAKVFTPTTGTVTLDVTLLENTYIDKDRTYIQLLKLPKELGVSPIKEVVTNRLYGVEVEEKGKLVNGKQLYSYTWKNPSIESAPTVLLSGLPTDLIPYGHVEYISGSWIIKDWVYSNGGMRYGYIYYTKSTGTISFYTDTGADLLADQELTFYYTKP